MFITALFTIAKTWKQPKCPPTDEWIKEIWYSSIHIHDIHIYYSYVYVYIVLSHKVEKAMAPHSSTLAWKIPWTEGPGGLQSMGLLRVGHDWATSLSLFPFMHWRRKWQPTPVLAWRIPGMGDPGGLPSMGSHRVGHDWSDLAAAAAIKKEWNNAICRNMTVTRDYHIKWSQTEKDKYQDFPGSPVVNTVFPLWGHRIL